ncbi:XdhC family protein [Pseudomonas taetrolens]|uniref:XdhC family protein n=1 Tax=Pseudomonas taetrolens TaxID=47884 RepID=UPI003F99CF05
MSDLFCLLDAMDSADKAGTHAVLATVIKVEGSAYRRPGARMLIPSGGQAVGTVSGGCLEQELVRKAWWLTESGQAVIRSYSTAARDDDESEDGGAGLAFGLGCNGTVHVLLERRKAGQPTLLDALLQRVRATGRPAALATVLSAGASPGLKIGARVGVADGIQTSEGVHDEAFQRWVQADLLRTLECRTSSRMVYELGAVAVEVFLEYIAPQRRLVIFGAGNDAQPLVRFAKELNWHVQVFDGRVHFARPERFPEADHVARMSIEQPVDLSPVVDGAAVVVMTHSYRQDRYWLKNVLECAPLYIGQLGPKERSERLFDELDICPATDGPRSRVHYPMGLDLGGDTPEVVALAIVSEIAACFNQRQGGMLKGRNSTIHDVTPGCRTVVCEPDLCR